MMPSRSRSATAGCRAVRTKRRLELDEQAARARREEIATSTVDRVRGGAAIRRGHRFAAIGELLLGSEARDPKVQQVPRVLVVDRPGASACRAAAESLAGCEC